MKSTVPIGVSVSQFDPDNIINDRGSWAQGDLSLWTPAASQLTFMNSNFYYLGLFATNNYANPPQPQGPLMCYQSTDADGNTMLLPPVGFSCIWTCSGNNSPSFLGIYSPVPPEGYRAIGCIAVMDFNNPPTLEDFPSLMCIREDLAIQVQVGGPVWTDAGSGVGDNVSVFSLPNSGTAFAYGTQHSQGYTHPDVVYDINPEVLASVLQK